MSTKAFIQHLRPSTRAVLLVAILAITVFANTVRSESIDNNHHDHPKDAFGFIQNLKGCHKDLNTSCLHNLKHYLEKFGYLERVGGDHNDEFDDALVSAIKSYQATYGLEVTGVLDVATAEKMARPRCGFPDKVNNNNNNNNNNSKDLGHHHHHHNNRNLIHKVSHFNLFQGAPRWSKSVLTYQFTNPLVRSVVRSVCASAFQRWAQVTDLTFLEIASGSEADIKLGFYSDDHGDGHAFDGWGGTLAHAMSPPDGRLHFDVDESWSLNPGPSTVYLESVAVHEIGHVLGLAHEPGIPQAIMYPYFDYGMIKRNLHADDIRGIRTLYA